MGNWVERCKILVKNFERTLVNATAKLNLCFIRLMLKELLLMRYETGSITSALVPSLPITNIFANAEPFISFPVLPM
ncbi:hypothetical protein [Synechococcus sp. PCC 7502]|uniref:hypothetical protein n=1 Tax=Synechococcus sp. PCC 7502 TaxID=1173263 RepID=UPI0002DB6616